MIRSYSMKTKDIIVSFTNFLEKQDNSNLVVICNISRITTDYFNTLQFTCYSVTFTVDSCFGKLMEPNFLDFAVVS